MADVLAWQRIGKTIKASAGESGKHVGEAERSAAGLAQGFQDRLHFLAAIYHAVVGDKIVHFAIRRNIERQDERGFVRELGEQFEFDGG